MYMYAGLNALSMCVVAIPKYQQYVNTINFLLVVIQEQTYGI